MRTIVSLLCGVILFVAMPTDVEAQNGAFVFRGENTVWLYEWNGESVLAVLSSDPDFSLQPAPFACGDEGEVVPFEVMGVFNPNAVKLLEKGDLFARVYYPAIPDDFESDPCFFLEEGPLVAEGIVHFVNNDNDFFLEDPNRQNSFGYTINGVLYDIGGLCSDGMVHMNIVRRFKYEKNCEEDCIYPQKLRGPALNCE
jgi:hypothetical protein